MIKVLICDDDKIVRDDIVNIVKEFGYVDYVKKVKDGIEVIEFIKNEKIDLLIIDIDMLYKNGIDFVEEIFFIDKDIYIVFVMGFVDYSFESFKVYFIDFVVKLFKKEKIFDLINIVIDYINFYKIVNNNFIEDIFFVYKIRK